ncbi:MAG: amidohydrolase, partial [Chloroflexi bacterium]|nr:amidohydrolase [Chloroflexota bacterium]
FRVYNDWVAEFCAAAPDRLKGVAMINMDDIQDAVSELERAAKLGLAGAVIPVAPADDKPYDLPIYDPFWAAAQDMDIPIILHVITNRKSLPTASTMRDQRMTFNPYPTAALFACHAYWVELSIANLILGGVLERYPRLKVVSAEHEAAWAIHFIRSLDYVYTQRVIKPGWSRFKDNAVPSDFFRRNVSISFQEDDAAIKMRSLIGVDNLMWGSDYPHPETTFPRSRQILAHILRGVPKEEKAKIVGGNAAKVFQFS